MGRSNSDRGIDGILKHLPDNGTTRRWKWCPRTRILWIDIAINKVDELDWAHKQMMRRGPCIVMLRVYQVIWTYYSGAASPTSYMNTTIGRHQYDLMDDAFSLASSASWNER